MEDITKVKAVKEEYKEKLLEKDNVVGVGVGPKNKDGEMSVIVFVEKKKPLDELSAAALVPEEIDGVKTDVIEVGEIKALGCTHCKKERPVYGGLSAMWYKGTACTLASVVYRNGRAYGLMNAHCGFPHWEGAKKGDRIIQPSPSDEGSASKDVIGYSYEVQELKFDGTPNKFDSCLIELIEKGKECYQEGIGKHLSEPADIKIGEEIVKSGRTTGVQTSRVIAINATARINYDEGRVAYFEDQVYAENKDKYFTAGGDSSSLVLNTKGNPVGQIYAGSPMVSLLSPIKPIMAHFGFKFAEKEAKPLEGYIALRKLSNVSDYVDIYPISAKKGNIGDTNYALSIRKGRGTENERIAVLEPGTKFEILDYEGEEDGYAWAKVRII